MKRSTRLAFSSALSTVWWYYSTAMQHLTKHTKSVVQQCRENASYLKKHPVFLQTLPPPHYCRLQLFLQIFFSYITILTNTNKTENTNTNRNANTNANQPIEIIFTCNLITATLGKPVAAKSFKQADPLPPTLDLWRHVGVCAFLHLFIIKYSLNKKENLHVIQ